MGDKYQLHARHLNPTLVEVLRITGFDRVYTRAQGAYLYDAAGNDYLDFLSGYSVFNMGSNHPVIKQAIRDVLDLDLPNMVQMDCSLLSGLLVAVLLKKPPPDLEGIFFCNSGTEAIEGALKFARAATGRPGLVALHGGYHGLSYGSLSVTGIANFQEGFGPLMSNVERVKMGDLATLDRLLRRKNVAAFLVEPVQGKGVKFPTDDFCVQAQILCRKYGTLFICDEIQTGLGRTGKWWAFEHWGLEPDILTVAKSLTGGYLRCGGIITRRPLHLKVFSRLDPFVFPFSTLGRENLGLTFGALSLA